MRRKLRLGVFGLLAVVAVLAAACESGGIGVGLPASGARWSSGGGGPDVFVGGGPTY